MLNKGQILDTKYEVIKTLGRGGMSTVYLCKNIRLDNLWAIKEVKKELKDQIDFLAEPNILKNLRHPGIPRVVDIFYEEDNLYMVEDYIQGKTLEDLIKQKDTIEPEEICKILLNICDIISYLHSFEPPIIYRDLKPSNIIVTPKDKVVLIDFGISRVYKHDSDKDTVYMGSKGYAAPEQYGSEQTCKQTDIYGLGAVIYFMVTKQAPLSLLGPLKDENYINKTSRGLKNIIQKCMQIDIQDRYSSVEQLQKELYQFLDEHSNNENISVENGEEESCNKTLIMDENGCTNILGETLINKAKDRRSNDEEFPKTMLINEEVQENKGDTKNLGNFSKHNSKIAKGTYEEDNSEKTRITGTAGVKKNLSKVQDVEKTRTDKDTINGSDINPRKIKFKKPVAWKLVSLLIAAVIVLGIGYLMTDHSKGEQITDSNKNQAMDNSNKDDNKNDEQTKIPADKVNQDNTNKSTSPKSSVSDLIIEGVIYKNSPIFLEDISGAKNESKSKANGKSKGKSKHKDESDDEESSAVKDIAFKLNPAALSGKYSNNFVIRLDYVEIRGNNIIAYCYIENKTDKNIEIKYASNTYLVDDKGKYLEANSNLSTNLSNIPAGTKMEKVNITFSNFNINTSKFILKTNVYSKDSGNSSKEELSLIVNVK